jgi:hypothetical protein
MKAKIILQPDQFTSFTNYYLEPLWQEYFDIEQYNKHKAYSKDSLFVFWWMNINDPLIKELVSQGHKVVVDNLWEVPMPDIKGVYQLSNSNWFYWNESLWWSALGHNQYIPDKTYKKLALMPIRRTSPVRDQIVAELAPFLDNMLWSYKDNRLPNDDYQGTDVNQRFLNPQWGDDCCINVVVENTQHNKIFNLTEKSYKPFALYQPMLIVGQAGSLSFLKNQGFETFDNIFDESYDQEPDFNQRLKLIIENLNQFKMEPYSPITWEKLRHNHNHFFNEQLCKQGIVKEIIEPLLHYAET